jgi:ATP-dependent helicase HrpB
MDTAFSELPMAAALPELCEALRARPNAIVVAPPGAGKTTLVPLALLEAPWVAGGRILMLEPRRVAARAAARRMAALRGEAVGGVIGYRTRIDAAVSAATRIEVITEGLLLRRLLADPGLEGVAAVILDEVHERSLEADLALALLRDAQSLFRPDLRLIAMSATAESDRLARRLDAAVITCEVRPHPVEISHATRDLASPRELPEAMARAIQGVLAATGDAAGDILAFLPGMAEIRRVMALLEGCKATLLALHGDLPPAEQDRALTPAAGRRVVLASAIAETSLTVPGVRVVIDGGFRRAPVLDPGTGLTRLATRRISRASATQRAGRAGREGPGRAFRLWTAALERGLPPADPPEIHNAELSSLALTAAAWGTAAEALPFLDPPPAGALAAAQALLHALGALDDDNHLTEAGRAMADLGAAPRLAAMMLAANDSSDKALAADLSALLEERDPLAGPDAPADIALRLGLLADAGRDAGGAIARLRQTARHYRRRLGITDGHRSDAFDPDAPGRLLAAAFPDRIAARRGEPGSFRLSGGGGARLSPSDPLARAPLLVAASLDAKGAARIRLAATLDPACLPPALAARISETVETSVDPASGEVFARRRRRLGALILEDRTLPASTEARAAGLGAWITADPARLPWHDRARQTQARIARIAAIDASRAPWPEMTDAAIATRFAHALAEGKVALERAADLAGFDLAGFLLASLDHAQRTALARDLPESLELPGGRAAIDYTGETPLAAARAQIFFGLDATPQLAGGRIPLRIALLSPAGRPIAITGDLAGFWRSGWAEVRRDMRGRYPRHPWPENPATAPMRRKNPP